MLKLKPIPGLIAEIVEKDLILNAFLWRMGSSTYVLEAMETDNHANDT
jgi:hypothetical protein